MNCTHQVIVLLSIRPFRIYVERRTQNLCKYDKINIMSLLKSPLYTGEYWLSFLGNELFTQTFIFTWNFDMNNCRRLIILIRSVFLWNADSVKGVLSSRSHTFLIIIACLQLHNDKTISMKQFHLVIINWFIYLTTKRYFINFLQLHQSIGVIPPSWLVKKSCFSLKVFNLKLKLTLKSLCYHNILEL